MNYIPVLTYEGAHLLSLRPDHIHHLRIYILILKLIYHILKITSMTIDSSACVVIMVVLWWLWHITMVMYKCNHGDDVAICAFGYLGVVFSTSFCFADLMLWVITVVALSAYF